MDTVSECAKVRLAQAGTILHNASSNRCILIPFVIKIQMLNYISCLFGQSCPNFQLNSVLHFITFKHPYFCHSVKHSSLLSPLNFLGFLQDVVCPPLRCLHEQLGNPAQSRLMYSFSEGRHSILGSIKQNFAVQLKIRVSILSGL